MSRTIGKEVTNTVEGAATWLVFTMQTNTFSSIKRCLLRHAAFSEFVATCLCNNRTLRFRDKGLGRSKCAQKLLWVFNAKTQGASSCRKQETKLSIFRCVGVGMRGGWRNWFSFTWKRRGRIAQGALCDFRPTVRKNIHINVSCQIVRENFTVLPVRMHSKSLKIESKIWNIFSFLQSMSTRILLNEYKKKRKLTTWYAGYTFKINVSKKT